MSAVPSSPMPLSRAAFLEWEATQPLKHEFLQGEVFAMTGARQLHVIVAGNCFALLKAHLRGRPCRAYISDMQLEVQAADAVFYPDVLVTCDPRDLAAERSLRHPVVVVEVLSDSTAAYDRGLKFAAYRKIPQLREYILIDPDARTVDIFRRTDTDEWLLATHDSARGLILESLDFEAGLDAVFEDLPDAAENVTPASDETSTG